MSSWNFSDLIRCACVCLRLARNCGRNSSGARSPARKLSANSSDASSLVAASDCRMARIVSKLVAPVFFSNVCFLPSNEAKISPCADGERGREM